MPDNLGLCFQFVEILNFVPALGVVASRSLLGRTICALGRAYAGNALDLQASGNRSSCMTRHEP